MFKRYHVHLAGRLICLLLFLSLLSKEVLAELPIPSAKHLIDAYAVAIRPFEHVSYSEVSRISKFVNGLPKDPVGRELVSTDSKGQAIFDGFYRCDGNRLDILNPKPTFGEKDAVCDPKNVRSRIIVFGDIWQTLTSSDGRRGGSVTQQSAKVAGIPPSELLANCRSIELTGGEVLDGWITGRRDKSLPDIFASAADVQVQPKTQLIDGHDTWLVKCTNGSEAFAAWLDPNLGCQPREIEGRNIGEGNALDVVVKQIQYQGVGEVAIATAAKITLNFRRLAQFGGGTVTFVNEYSRSDVDFRPDFAAKKAFYMVAPLEYSALNLDLVGVRWRLQDGKFLPAEDASIIQSVGKFADSTQIGREQDITPKGTNSTVSSTPVASAGLPNLGQSSQIIEVPWKSYLLVLGAAGCVATCIIAYYIILLRKNVREKRVI